MTNSKTYHYNVQQDNYTIIKIPKLALTKY